MESTEPAGMLPVMPGPLSWTQCHNVAIFRGWGMRWAVLLFLVTPTLLLCCRDLCPHTAPITGPQFVCFQCFCHLPSQLSAVTFNGVTSFSSSSACCTEGKQGLRAEGGLYKGASVSGCLFCFKALCPLFPEAPLCFQLYKL